ncbi:polysaccharide biosynthesis/export family protein [Longimicrobium sp.]|uniref:polysaccharide biosynthesis/export family protein n=1 Tax=Longimicrobium sp. TaxID=2029185 RepID=UPI002F92F15F
MAPLRRRLAAALAAALLAGAPAAAQQTDSAASRRPAAAQPVLLDAPVSRTAYRLGPGDELTLSITGNVNRVWTVAVTPDGSAVVPELGVVRVLGLNLDQAQARVRDLVTRFYQGVSVNLALSAARRFKVFVVGSVPEPGYQVASPASRVSEVVPAQAGPGVLRRNVVVRRATGDSLVADLVRFRQLGELEANPALLEGDVVVVPAADDLVQVFGRVHFAGGYEYRGGESLADLLAVANGPGGFPANAADTIRVTRFVGPQEREFRLFSRQQALGAEGRAFVMRPGDAVFVPELSNFRVQQTATITGQVVRPGAYPIRPDTTTVRELVAMAGGFTAEASLAGATLRRQGVAAHSRSLQQLQAIPAEVLSDEERRVLQARSQGDPDVVVIDFQRLFGEGGSALDQPLEDGDILNVPERRSGVSIVGAVTQPGIVTHLPGRDVEEYVRLAGGYSRRADRRGVTVLRARLGTETDARDVTRLEPGDQIVVPFRRRRDPLQTLQTVQAVVGSVSSLIFAYLALRPVFFPDRTP